MDIHRQSHLVHNLEVIEAPLVIHQMENFRVQRWESLVLRYVRLGRCQEEMEMVRLRYRHWDTSIYLVHSVEIRQAFLLESQMGRLVFMYESQYGLEMVNWRILQQERSHFVQMVDMRQATPMVDNMGVEMESLRDLHWKRSHLVQMVELRQATPMLGHMGVGMESLRNRHWKRSHLVQMVDLRKAPKMVGHMGLEMASLWAI